MISPSSPANINTVYSISSKQKKCVEDYPLLQLNDGDIYHHIDNSLYNPPETRFGNVNRPRSNSSTKETLIVHKNRDGNGLKMVNEYVFVRKLGAGTYGKVSLAYHSGTHQLYAIKVFNKTRLKKKRLGLRNNPLDDVLKEITILKKLNHHNIVKLYEVINDPNQDSIYIVMEYLEGGSIMPNINYQLDCNSNNNNENQQHKQEVITPLSEDVARRYFRDILLGLEYLHEQKIIHRDIKPENLLISKDGHVVIADFGVSHMFDDTSDLLNSSAGSPAFLAPELCGYQDGSVQISGKATDVWALGISLYCMIFAQLPFLKSSTLQNIYDNIQFQPIQYPREISNQLLDLFHKILDRNPLTRITTNQIKCHPWTSENGQWPLLNSYTLQINDHDPLTIPTPIPSSLLSITNNTVSTGSSVSSFGGNSGASGY
ncbi:putative protein serine/threonine kinase [Tieghemostelium lacteum]|uniref:non-specific serine/threonine protein kinase n=1 Tax=Tieghemostelium lacteum TaxID=361077 RepID=A0A151Z9G0_TIELA|nr:putative protein serine/threonine kinase [Tieghemostelium lacteum]|eukprot:KYQ90582.1 putative protein serine/threonine kinase [Tieghemostelium lacteum]